MLRSALCLAVALMFAPAMGSAQDFDAGVAAYEAGDYATALREWRPLAEQGLASAQRYLGYSYRFGKGVPQDNAEAATWLRKAAEQGDAGAQFNLGMMYMLGHAVPLDRVQGVSWIRKAAAQGHAPAQRSLGSAYEHGGGVPQDFVSAHMWFNLASGNGAAYAPDWRDQLAEKMTPADISEAQRRARVCHASAYQDCD